MSKKPLQVLIETKLPNIPSTIPSTKVEDGQELPEEIKDAQALALIRGILGASIAYDLREIGSKADQTPSEDQEGDPTNYWMAFTTYLRALNTIFDEEGSSIYDSLPIQITVLMLTLQPNQFSDLLERLKQANIFVDPEFASSPTPRSLVELANQIHSRRLYKQNWPDGAKLLSEKLPIERLPIARILYTIFRVENKWIHFEDLRAILDNLDTLEEVALGLLLEIKPEYLTSSLGTLKPDPSIVRRLNTALRQELSNPEKTEGDQG